MPATEIGPPPNAMVWVGECPGPKPDESGIPKTPRLPESTTPGREVIIANPILNGHHSPPRIICDNFKADGTCKLLPAEDCIFTSKGAPASLNMHLYPKMA